MVGDAPSCVIMCKPISSTLITNARPRNDTLPLSSPRFFLQGLPGQSGALIFKFLEQSIAKAGLLSQ